MAKCAYIADCPTPSIQPLSTMPQTLSARTAEIETQVKKALEALKTKVSKTVYAAAKQFNLHPTTLNAEDLAHQSGKRLVTNGHFMLRTIDIHENVVEAKEEAASKTLAAYNAASS
jgi:hypothetical protein